MRRKSFAPIILAAGMIVSLTACSQGGETVENIPDASSSVDTAASGSDEPSQEASTEETEETEKETTQTENESASEEETPEAATGQDGEEGRAEEESTEQESMEQETTEKDTASDEESEESQDEESQIEETAEQEETSQSPAPTKYPTPVPTKVPETTEEEDRVKSITASVSGSHYIGDTLTGADFTVTVTMSDGTTLTNPAGWSASPLALTGETNKVTVSYQGVSTTVTVKAAKRPAAMPAPTEAPTPTSAPTPDPTQTPTATKTYGLDEVPEGLEIRENPYGSTCLLSLTPTFTNAGVDVHHYNGEYVSPEDYEYMVTYQGNNGIIVYRLKDDAKKNVTGLENVIAPQDDYRITLYYKGLTFETYVSESKGYRPDTYDEEAAQLEFNIFNQERNSLGLNSLIWNDTLAELAKIRAKELQDDFSHKGCFSGASEIISAAMGTVNYAANGGPESLANITWAAWKGSPGHYSIITSKHSAENPNGSQMYCGIAYYRSTDGSVYAVALFTNTNNNGGPLLNGVVERNPAYLD